MVEQSQAIHSSYTAESYTALLGIPNLRTLDRTFDHLHVA